MTSRIAHRTAFALALSLCLPGAVRATDPISLSGTIVDADSQDPLPGVNVIVASENASTVTDLSGHYVLWLDAGAANSTVQVEASFEGFVPDLESVSLNSSEVIQNFTLTPGTPCNGGTCSPPGSSGRPLTCPSSGGPVCTPSASCTCACVSHAGGYVAVNQCISVP